MRTERGCGSAAESSIEEQAYAILRKTMNIQRTSSSRLRLVNNNGALELVPLGRRS